MHVSSIAAAAASSTTPATLDRTDVRLLVELAREGRATWAELGRRVALSPPATRDRVRRLEDSGIITGYHARIDPSRMGSSLTAYVRIAVPTNARQSMLEDRLASLPEVSECHSLTGEDSFLLKVHVADTAALDALTSELSRYGRTTTSIVLSTLVDAHAASA